MRRIERLINLIAALLEAEVPMTAESIRDRISGYESDNHEAFRRAFERDKADLKAMGIPVETVELEVFGDAAPGYIIPKSRYYLPELDLEPDELAALRIAAGAVLGVEEEAGSGVLKLSMGALDETSSGARLAWNADVAASQPLLGSLYSAVVERVPITIDYQPAGSDEPGTRTVNPYALVHRKGHWYLVGHDDRSNETRTFKVARIISEPKRQEGTYEVPAGFSADQHVLAHVGNEGEDVVASVRFAAPMRWWPEQNLPGAQGTEGPDGSYTVEMPVATLDALVSFAVWLGPNIEILAPPEARARMKERMTGRTS
ncbi:MAG: proteasome accessory factor [Actinomycetota bacterium]|jgi:predicted DNA-binding transcriptional regulator YafY|nr:proteasome accessory factor [Actinomycetota bacterium]